MIISLSRYSDIRSGLKMSDPRNASQPVLGGIQEINTTRHVKWQSAMPV